MISTSGLNYALALLAALGCGTIAGVFFAFSTFVMKALARLPPEEGIAAMQSINVFAINSWFLVGFVGTAGLCVATVIAGVVQWSEPFAILLMLGGVTYLAGCFAVTMVFNVPMNQALAALSPVDLSGPPTGQVTSAVGQRGTMCEPPPLCWRPPCWRSR